MIEAIIRIVQLPFVAVFTILKFAWKYKVGTVILLLCFWDSIGVFLVNTISQAIFNILLEIIEILFSAIFTKIEQHRLQSAIQTTPQNLA